MDFQRNQKITVPLPLDAIALVHSATGKRNAESLRVKRQVLCLHDVNIQEKFRPDKLIVIPQISFGIRGDSQHIAKYH
jgi:hypothetical protein